MTPATDPAPPRLGTVQENPPIDRDPPGRRRALWKQVTSVVVGNAVVAYLLLVRQINPVYLVLLVGLEAMLLSVVETCQQAFVPREAIPEELRGGGRLFTLAFCLVALLFMNGMLLAGMFDAGPALLVLLKHPIEELVRAQLFWPLAITLAAGLLDARRDLKNFAAAGGTLVSTPGWNGRARWLTLTLGAIPSAIILLAPIWVAGKVLERSQRKVTNLLLWALGGIVLSGFYLAYLQVSSGFVGWTIGYCIAKVTSELLILTMPLAAAPAGERKSAQAGEERMGRKRKR